MKEVTYFSDEIIFDKNNIEQPSLFIITKGKVEIFMDLNANKLQCGKYVNEFIEDEIVSFKLLQKG